MKILTRSKLLKIINELASVNNLKIFINHKILINIILNGY